MIIFTVCSPDAMPYALALHESLLRHHPGVRFYVAVRQLEPDQDRRLPFDVLQASDLGLPDPEGLSARSDDHLFNSLLKPLAFQWLFDQHPASGVLYLDPDVYTTGPLEELIELTLLGTKCVLVPVSIEPAEHAEIDDDELLRYGVYDLGLCWLANDEAVRRVVWWWARRIEQQCRAGPGDGHHPDQRWANLFPAFLDDVRILRHPGYGVAYWNLSQRRLRDDGQSWRVNGRPLRCVHFRGCTMEDGPVLSPYSSLFDMTNAGPMAELVREYRNALRRHGL